ncbi:tetratricopeptide repeat protein [Azospirillum brasilense]|uniref:tetratricopeptide repeat protein n=1 Tax=Azospirillum brasilense TaxID=192 RepID=UPI000E698592|nr:tetratricopeptide repeat protein [Azospirillum brasilense]NUB23973.1 tetratricopeptide repeat protein [Azospirillum brasilense]NUB31036.1 tetratricopeptide repeat protein [Azospirillum brasilense]RIW01905.1 tetratricopeptide repeat protein [Azospirillum brasilense]
MATIIEALLAAIDHHQSGRLAEAATLYGRILEADPEQPDAAQLLGVLQAQTGRPAEGARLLRRALALRPVSAGAQSNLAGALQTMGDAAAAEAGYARALRLDPLLADAHASRAGALRDLNRVSEAARSAQRALALLPASADALVNLAETALAGRRAEEAERTARRAAALAPGSSAAWMMLGSACAARKRWNEAEAAYRTALDLAPGYGAAWGNLGSLLAGQGRFDEALAAFATAEQHGFCGPSLWSARGTAWLAMARPAEALADFDRVLEVRPDDAGMRWNRGFARLLAGDCEGGWPEFDWRRHDARAEPPWRRFAQPTWTGGDIAGHTVLLYAEQGLGDTLQFVRYVPLVAARGARVILEVQRPLMSVLSGLPGMGQLIARGDPLPDFDLECPLMSLPRAFGTRLDDVPATVPYLHPDPERAAAWSDRLAAGPGLRVGLVWAGNPRFPGDALRSPRLAGLRPVLDVPGVRFYGLQKGPGREDLDRVPMPSSFTDLGPDIADFADTAAIMANLDLVISSCTGPAHLAGALGVPVWVVLPHSPDWRWLLEREDSPWYPNARLFRQTRVGDWAEVAGRVADALRNAALRTSA